MSVRAAVPLCCFGVVHAGDIALILRSDKQWHYAQLKTKAPSAQGLTLTFQSTPSSTKSFSTQYHSMVKRLPPAGTPQQCRHCATPIGGAKFCVQCGNKI